MSVLASGLQMNSELYQQKPEFCLVSAQKQARHSWDNVTAGRVKS